MSHPTLHDDRAAPSGGRTNVVELRGGQPLLRAGPRPSRESNGAARGDHRRTSGPNGAGKSTAIGIMLGLLDADHGRR